MAENPPDRPPAARRAALERRLGAALARWVDLVRRRAGLVLLGALLLAAGALAYAATNLGVLSDTEALFDESLRFRELRARLEETFPALQDNVLVVIDAPNAARADEAARFLREQMEAEPELFRHLLALGSGPFWDEYGLLYLDLEELEAMSDALVEAQPFLAELSRDGSLARLLDLLERAVRVREHAPPDEMALAMDELARALDAARAGEPVPSLTSLLPSAAAGPGTRRLLLFQPRPGYTDDFVPARASLARLEELGQELGRDGVSLRFTGDIALQYEEFEIVRGQARLAGLASFLLVAAILALALRSPRQVAATLVSLLTGLAWTAGFAALAIGHLNVISLAFAVLFIGLSVDFGIHFCLHYRGLREAGAAHGPALRETAADVGSSLAVCAATTALGFLAFVPTGYDGVAELGVISAAGMVASLVCSLTVLPAVLSLGLREGPLAPIRRLRLRLPAFPARHPTAVLAAAGALALAAAAFAPRWHFDANPLRVRDPGARSVQLFEELLAEGEINPWTAEVVAPDLESARELAARLRPVPSVERVVTLASFVPEAQAEKRALLRETEFLLNLPARFEPAGAAPVDVARTSAAARALRDALAEARDDGVVDETAHALESAVAALLALPAAERERVLARVDHEVMAPLREATARLARALDPGPLAIPDLPEALRERMLGAGGAARVQVFPAGDLMEVDFAARFVGHLREITPDVTGVSVYTVDSASLIVRALREAFALAFAGVALLLLVLWRRPGDAALVLATLLLAAWWTAGVAVVLGLPLNFANVIVLPLLLGIGVDSGIHLVHRHRSGGDRELLATPTSRAVVWSALTTIASFGTLGFTTHRGMSSLGQLLALGVAVTALATLVVLPALVAGLARRGRRAGG